MPNGSVALLASSACFVVLNCGGVTKLETTDGGSHPDSRSAPDDALADGTAGNCTAGTVNFHMSAAGGRAARYCVGRSCSDAWLDVRSANGTHIGLQLGCQANCDTCGGGGCPPICPLPHPMPADGERKAWDGSSWIASTCGRSGQSCATKTCAPPGAYIATMCAELVTSDAGPFACSAVSMSPNCVEVAFDYPGTGNVEGELP